MTSYDFFIMTTTHTVFRELLDNTIENNNLYGHSFTYGRAFELLVKRGVFSGDDDLDRKVDTMLIESTANYLGLDESVVEEKMSQGAMVETLDLAVLDDMASSLTGVEHDD